MLALGFVVEELRSVGAFGPVPKFSRHSHAETLLIGWTCVALFGFCLALFVPKLFEAGAQLRIDAAGIRYPQWSDATIPWLEITRVTGGRYRSSKVIVLHLKDRHLFPGKGLTALLAGADRSIIGGDIFISLADTDRSYDEARTAIDQYRALYSYL